VYGVLISELVLGRVQVEEEAREMQQCIGLGFWGVKLSKMAVC